MSDPYSVLGVSDEADDGAIREAYLAALKASPPERDRERFEAVRIAYEAIRGRRERLSHELFDTTPPTVVDALNRAAPEQPPQRPAAALFEALLRGDK